MAGSTALVTILMLGLIATNPQKAHMTGIKICQLAPNTEVQIKLSNDTLVRKSVTDKNGNIVIFIKKLYGNDWVIESASVNGKQFRFKASEMPITSKSSIFSVGCVKLL